MCNSLYLIQYRFDVSLMSPQIRFTAGSAAAGSGGAWVFRTDRRQQVCFSGRFSFGPCQVMARLVKYFSRLCKKLQDRNTVDGNGRFELNTLFAWNRVVSSSPSLCQAMKGNWKPTSLPALHKFSTITVKPET